MPDNNRISTEVILPETITEVGNYEFYSCRSLQQVELPKGLVSIAADAFYSIPDITMLVYENSYGHLWCIENNVAFKIIGTSIVPSESAWTLPPSLRAIAEEAFLGLGMTEVVIPGGALSIAKRAFADCHELTYVFIPDSVVEIALDAFENCDAAIIVCSADSYAAQFAESAGVEWIEN